MIMNSNKNVFLKLSTKKKPNNNKKDNILN